MPSSYTKPPQVEVPVVHAIDRVLQLKNRGDALNNRTCTMNEFAAIVAS
ncbi:MAG: hypothetical protein HXY51_14550 [Nitrospirae bacterium]|nr:hypothetical protein [Nitrospirota bacterium]